MSNHRVDVSTGMTGDALAQTVARLRAERDGLRRAMQSRSVIEQAKGVLMARHRLTADQAFDQLLTASQRSNTKLAQVAAAVVATVSPPPEVGPAQHAAPDGGPPGGDEPGRDGAGGDEPGSDSDGRASGVGDPVADVLGTAAAMADATAAAHTRHLLTVARLHAAQSYEDVVDALAEAPPRPRSAVLLLREADGALRLMAARGLSAEVVSQWGRIPPQVEVPLTDAARRGLPVWLPDRETTRRVYPLVSAIGTGAESTAAVPLTHGGRVVGVLGLTWSEREFGGAGQRSFLAALGEVCGAATVRIARAAGLPATEDGWLRPLLDAVLGAAAVLRPVTEDGRITDFVFDVVNDRAAADAERLGLRTTERLLLTELPEPGASVLLPLYRDVLADGRPRQLDDLMIPPRAPGDPPVRLLLRAERLGDRVVVSWRARSPGELLYEDLMASEQVAGVASLRWRPAAGEWLPSPNLAGLLDWPRGGPALTPTTVWRAVADVHWPAVRRAAVAALRGASPPSVTVLTRRGRWLRLTLTALEEGGLRGTAQDVSELRAVLSRHFGQAPARAPRR